LEVGKKREKALRVSGRVHRLLPLATPHNDVLPPAFLRTGKGNPEGGKGEKPSKEPVGVPDQVDPGTANASK